MKTCEMCEKNYVEGKTRFCDECKSIRKRKSQKKYYKRNSANKIEERIRELEDNFKNINPSGIDLIQCHFNKISEISASSYRKQFKMSWIEVLEHFGKYEEMKSYLLKCFKDFHNRTGSESVIDMLRELGAHVSMVKEIGYDDFYLSIGKTYFSPTVEDHEENFRNVVKILGHIPLYIEFLEHSKIHPSRYADKFNIKGTVYDTIVKMYVSEEEFKEYKVRQQSHKKEIGRQNHQGHKHSDRDMEIEFKRVYEEYYKETGEYPTDRVFNKLTNIDESLYRHRHKVPFSSIIKMYGYEEPESKWITEKTVINMFDSILNSVAETQKTFEWMLSAKGFPLRCDGYYKDYNLIIEFDGKQHFEPIEFFGGQENFERVLQNDRIKDRLIKEKGMTIIRIAYNEPYWDKEFLKSRLIESGICLNRDKTA